MKLITQVLHKYRDHLGADFDRYHHHAQRVYQYAITLLLMRESKKVAIAAAFHDLDIWVNDTMNYLPGSVGLARTYLDESDFEILPDEMDFIIRNHHKLTKIKGNLEAEAFRKADLIDLTAGKIKFNLPGSIIFETEQKYPRLHFTGRIMKKGLNYALKHPLSPFPMIKW